MAITKQQFQEFLTDNTNKNIRGRYVLSMASGDNYKIVSSNIGNVWSKILSSKLEDNIELFENTGIRDESMLTIQVRLEWKKDAVGEFTRAFKKGLVTSFQRSIRDLLTSCKVDPDIIAEVQKCCIVTYDARYKNKLDTGIENTTMRLIFPNLVTTVALQQQVFSHALIKCRKLNVVNLLDKMPHTLELKNIISMTNGVALQILLPGTNPRYEFYGIIAEDEYNIDNSKIQMADIFDLKSHQDIANGNINYDFLLESVGEKMTSYLPLFISRNYGLPIPVTYTQTFTRQPNIASIGNGYKHGTEYTHIELARIFLELLSDDRFFIRPYFMDIGRALHAIYKGDNEGKNVWFRYADRSLRDNEEGELPDHLINLDDYALEYMKFTEKDYGIDIRTLAWYAKEDSPDEYNEWQDSWILSAVEKTIGDINDRNVAIIFYRITWLTLLTAPDGLRTAWYKYTGSIWKRSSNTNSVIKIFEDDLIDRLESMLYKLIERDALSMVEPVEGAPPAPPGSQDSPYVKQLKYVVTKVSTHGFMRSVLSWSAAQLQVEDFYKLKDENINLTAMLDGVVESSYRTKSIIFRSGKPQDYLTLCTYKTFPVHYTWNSPEVKMYVQWVKQMYGSPELCRHFHKLIASAYVGGNLEKIIVFLTGGGNNGKSTMVRCLGDAFGDYLSIFPFNLLTSEAPDPSRPCPLLFSLSGPRLSVGMEGAADKEMRAEVLKIWAGNDKIPGRLNFSNDIVMLTPTTTFIAVVNDVPPMRGFGTAIRSRTKIFPNDTTYSKTAPEDKLLQKITRTYPMVSTFIDSVGRMAQAVLWIAYQFFPIYVKDGLIDPPEITKATEQYWKDTDVYAMFIDERMEGALINVDGVAKKDESVELSIDVAYNAFNLWYMERNHNQTCPSRNNFSRYMLDCELVGKSVNRHWKGVKLVQNINMGGCGMSGGMGGMNGGMNAGGMGMNGGMGGWHP